MRTRLVSAEDGAHAALVKRAARWLSGRRCHAILPEFHTWSTGHEIPDVIGWRVRGNGAQSVLVEVKVSRADFLADRKKGVRVTPALGMGARRWYFTPPGVLAIHELPPRWGLAECSGRTVRVVHEATTFPEYAARHEISLLVQAIRREHDAKWGSRLYMAPEHAEEGSAGSLEAP